MSIDISGINREDFLEALWKDNMKIDISGINRDELLEALWKGSSPASYFRMANLPPPSFDINKAKSELRYDYADYVCGRVIKADIYSEDTVDPFLYDKYNGSGALQKIVNLLRNKQ